MENATTSPLCNILLVEDEASLRDTIAEALAIYGFPVTAVSSGLDFYQTLTRERYAVAIIDLGLPDLDGSDLVAYLRQNTTLKIIIVSARPEVADRVKGYYAGADLYLVKPVHIEELAAAIHSLSRRRTEVTVTATDSWRLESRSWRLLRPNGIAFRLNPKEYQLLAEMAATPGAPVTRATLLKTLYDQDHYAGSRALDYVIFRFRSRYREETGSDLPLVTIPGVGFQFVASLLVI